MARLNKERETELEPERMLFAVREIEKLGYVVDIQPGSKSLQFKFKDHVVILFPYSGHTGKTITDGSGLNKLLKQIR